MFSITVLVSGGGTNLQAIIDSIANGELKDAGVYIKKVISNNKEAFALERAKNNGIETSVISPKDYPDRAAFEVALKSAIDESAPDLIVLAGFLVVIPEAIVRSYPKKIINIHPSLIPSFCGKGYYGLKVHEAALARGVKVTGATVHFVDEGTDTGPIILQKAVEVKEGDTPEVLQQRVMKEAEHILLPHAIALLAKERV
ncbi:MAG: phosphoribosylglycinamide formyltransferase [Lachnospiraceae bacterium]|nr:phosphoribosylglycinamide formyltransferase [Lachnospiraceae bacterium]